MSIKTPTIKYISILILVFLCFIIRINFCIANCNFNVINNSDVKIYVEAGFYKSNIKPLKFKVNNASNNKLTLAGEFNCTSIDSGGLGLAYIKLINPPHNKNEKNIKDTNLGNAMGSWVYIPSSKMIKAVGISLNSQEYSLGSSPDKIPLLLINNYNPNQNDFEVLVKQASRNISKPASMN